MGKHSQVNARYKKASAELDAAGPNQLFDLLQDRLKFGDSSKNQLISLTPAEQLARAETMVRPPQSVAEREFYGEILWTNVCIRFKQELSTSDLSLWENPPADASSSPAHVRLLKSFDAFVLAQFRYFGPALLMSYGALQRIFQWRKYDSLQMKLLGAELELNSRVARGDVGARLPIGRELGASKPEAVRELRMLFGRVRSEFSSKNRTARTIAEWSTSKIQADPDVFRFLFGNLPQFQKFLQAPEQEERTLGIVTGRPRPASFYDAWVASATRFSVQRARQEMSKSRR